MYNIGLGEYKDALYRWYLKNGDFEDFKTNDNSLGQFAKKKSLAKCYFHANCVLGKSQTIAIQEDWVLNVMVRLWHVL